MRSKLWPRLICIMTDFASCTAPGRRLKYLTAVEFKEISAAEVPPGGSQPPYFGHGSEDDPEQEQFLQDLGRELEELESLPPAPALSPAATALPSLPPPPPACAMEELPECLAPPAPVVPVEALLPSTVASRVEQPSSLPVFGSQLSCAELPAQRAPVESAPSQSVSGLLEPPQKASVEALPSQLVSGVPEPPAPHAAMEPPALPKSAAVVAGAKSHAPSQAQKLVQSQASPQASTRTLPPREEIPWSNVTAQGLSNLFRVPVSSLKKNSSFARLDSQETLAYACDTPSKIRRTSSPPPLQRLWSMQSMGNASVSSDASEAANATGSVSEAEIGAPTPVRLPSQDAAEDDADLVEARLAIMLEALKEARMAKRKLSSQELNASTSSLTWREPRKSPLSSECDICSAHCSTPRGKSQCYSGWAGAFASAPACSLTFACNTLAPRFFAESWRSCRPCIACSIRRLRQTPQKVRP